MNRLFKLLAGLLVGAAAFLGVTVGVTEALDPYVWPSLMLGLPAGLVAGVGTVPVVYFGLTYREERTVAGQASPATVSRLLASVAAVVAFVAVGGIATAAMASIAVGLATALLFVGFPAGLVGAALAAFLASRQVRRSTPSNGPVAQWSRGTEK
jgi:hypothetical protein